MGSDRRLMIEEIANTITHGIGLVMSLIGLAALIALAWTRGTAVHLAACSIYGITLVLVYAASTLYHSIQRPQIKHYFRLFDHVAIFLVIAGTYTPFMLINLRGFWGWTVLGLVWALSIFGILFKLAFVNRFRFVTYALYVAIGWMALIAAKPILESVPLGCLAWIMAGGIAYMTGLIFFAWNKLPFNHTIWHVFVMAGSICHYCAVVLYVVP